MEPRCRICLEPNSLLDIFSSTDITPTLQEIEETTGIHITAASRLPKFLCLNCVCEISNAYQLRVKARCSDARLREIYPSNESNEIMPVVKVERKRERSSSNESTRSYLDATPIINEGRPKKEKLSADWRVADNDAKVTIRKVQKSNFHEEIVVALPRKSGSPPKRKVNMATIKKTRTKPVVSPPKPVKIERPPVEPRERPTKFEAICEICAKLLTSNRMFIEHMNAHNDLRPFKCTDCTLSFNYRTCLTRHRLTHTKEKPYKCDICSNSYRASQHLKYHKLMTHGTEADKKFRCNLCDKAFVLNFLLTAHKKDHYKGTDGTELT